MKTPAELVHLSSTERFDEVVDAYDGPVLLDFYADWCGPCRMVTPLLEEFVEVAEAPARVVKIDVDAHPSLARRFGVQGIPTLVLIQEGDEADRIVGVPSLNALLDWVEGRAVA